MNPTKERSNGKSIAQNKGKCKLENLTNLKKRNLTIVRLLEQACADERDLPSCYIQKLMDRLPKMRHCCRMVITCKCPACTDYHVTNALFCKARVCPICGRQLMLKRYAQNMQTFDYMNANGMIQHAPVFITLTVRNVSNEDLQATLKEMAKGFNRIAVRNFWKNNTAGYIKTVEITRGTDNQSWHPHMHILVFPSANLSDRDWRIWLGDAWKKAMRLDYDPIIHFEHAYYYDEEGRRIRGSSHLTNDASVLRKAVQKATLEASKYAIKPLPLDELEPQDLLTLAYSMEDLRFLSYGGIVKEARKILKLKDDDTVEDIDERGDTNICPEHGLELTHYAATFAIDGYRITPLPKTHP